VASGSTQQVPSFTRSPRRAAGSESDGRRVEPAGHDRARAGVVAGTLRSGPAPGTPRTAPGRARWSRFVPTSECRPQRCLRLAGECADAACSWSGPWRLAPTGGRFDPRFGMMRAGTTATSTRSTGRRSDDDPRARLRIVVDRTAPCAPAACTSTRGHRRGLPPTRRRRADAPAPGVCINVRRSLVEAKPDVATGW
jgi:hypothetical protein